jgi:DNA-binding NtrC family response regulator
MPGIKGRLPMTNSQLKGARVLVVEDEYLIASDLARELERAGALPVGPAATVAQAKAILDKQPVDAAILDVNLRGDMAYPLVERLSAGGMPCVIVSGYSPQSLPDSLIHVVSMEKPVSYEKVIEKLAVQLSALRS